MVRKYIAESFLSPFNNYEKVETRPGTAYWIVAQNLVTSTTASRPTREKKTFGGGDRVHTLWMNLKTVPCQHFSAL
jgi:hypothetical protein